MRAWELELERRRLRAADGYAGAVLLRPYRGTSMAMLEHPKNGRCEPMADDEALRVIDEMIWANENNDIARKNEAPFRSEISPTAYYTAERQLRALRAARSALAARNGQSFVARSFVASTKPLPLSPKRRAA